MRSAEDLAAGQGYTWPNGPWPGKPTTNHPPLWPALVSVTIRCSLFSNPISAIHATGLLFHGATIVGAVLLAYMLSGSAGTMWRAGLSVALWPGALNSIVAGWSEPCAAAVLILGGALVFLGGWSFWCGVLVLSAMPLVRTNFLAFPALAVIAWAICEIRRPDLRLKRQSLGQLALAAILLYVPSVGWIARNYRATGVFPVFSSEGGRTFYGAYNSFTAAAGQNFAGLILPQFLPGEQPPSQMAARMSELDVDRYYQRRGIQFVRAHWQEVPALVLGHIARAFLPQQQSIASGLVYPEWICRFALYGSAIFFLIRKPPPLWFASLLAPTALTVAVTVIVFAGEQRFIYPLTVLLIIFVCSRLGQHFSVCSAQSRWP
ncbi:MAG: hypothetical protein JO062_04315 [Bryobacterales bacterium]|nr:hypothetical protein [Bryobacterales bacterium]